MSKIQSIRVTITTLGQSKESFEDVIIRLRNSVSNSILVNQTDIGHDEKWDNDQTKTLPSGDTWYNLVAGTGNDTDLTRSGELQFMVAKMPTGDHDHHKWSWQLNSVLCRTDDGKELQLVNQRDPVYILHDYKETWYPCNAAPVAV